MQSAHRNSLTKKGDVSKNSETLKANDKLRHLAFDNSVQANIITTVADHGKIIMANKAAARLFGYSKKELLTKTRAAVFNIGESSFKKMMKQRTEVGNASATVTVRKKNGKFITCQITSAVFVNEDGKKNAITTITDMSKSILLQKNIDIKKDKAVADNIGIARSKQKAIDVIKVKKVSAAIDLALSKQKKLNTKNEKLVAVHIIEAQAKSDARLLENNRWIKYMAKSSYDVMWDWDIASGSIYAGDSIKEVFGYSVQNNTMTFSKFCSCLVPYEKEMVEQKIKDTLASDRNTWEDAFLFKRRDGSLASTISRASIVRDETGRAVHVIGAMQDVSSLENMEKKLQEQAIIHEQDSEKFLLAARLSFDVIWDWNIATNEVFLGDGFEELFGYKIENNKGNMITDWVNYLHQDDKAKVVAELQGYIKSNATHWQHAYRVRRADGSVAKVYVRASIVRDAAGKAYRIIGAMQDLSRQKELEEKLEKEIVLKETQIAAATEDAKEMERSDIGKELHDNINQLLGASKMYIDMAKRGGSNSAMYLSRSSEYIISAINEIRKLTKGLTNDLIRNLGLCDAIDNIARDAMEVSPVEMVITTGSFIENSVNDKFKLNVLRIVQEQLNNILKHANANKVTIELLQNKKIIQLTITDNGMGFNARKKRSGIGIPNIKSRAAAYQGTAAFDSKPGQGCILTAIFPVTAQLLCS